MAARRNQLRQLACFLLLFNSCQIQVPVSPTTLRIGMGAEPDTLNPITASDAYASRIHSFVGDSLIDRDRDTLEFIPKLAVSWKVSRDYLSYTFYLRPNIRWHDGHPFSADDVVYSFERVKDPKVEAPFLRVYYSDVDRVEKIDSLTVRFVYKQPYFLGLAVCGSIPLVPKHVYERGGDFNHHPANRFPIGLGPYRFVEWKTNKRLVLERFDDYWGPKPAVSRIVFRIITDDTVALQVLKKGEIDMASLRPIQWVKQTQSDRFNEAFNKFKYLLPGYNYIGWNNKSPLFADSRVRLAMTHLVDREKMLDKLNFGLGEVVVGPFFPGSEQYHSTLKPHRYDPALSRDLLREAGWEDRDGDGLLDKEGRVFSLTFVYPAASKFAERLAAILKEDLKQMGIQMTIERMEWAAFIDRIEKKDFDATSLGWSTNYEGDPYQIWHSSQAAIERGSNFVSFTDPLADRLIEAARTEFDPKARNRLYGRFQEILHEEQPYTFLFANYSLVVVAKRFKNVQMHKTGLDVLEWTL